MSSDNISIGLDNGSVNSTSIMKPPGGDSHDIFGADFHGTPSHHRVLKPPGGGTSGLFATPSEDHNQKVQLGSNPASPQTSNPTLLNGMEIVHGKNGNESVSMTSLETGENDLDAVSVPSSVISAEIKNLTAQLQKRHLSGNPLTGDGFEKMELSSTRVPRQRDGNPVTGEGYDTPDTRHGPQQQPRARIPPGGYSSGLW